MSKVMNKKRSGSGSMLSMRSKRSKITITEDISEGRLK